MPVKIFPVFINSKTSRLKVLKVVSPPNSPVIKNIRNAGWNVPLYKICANKYPIKKQPTILTTKVPKNGIKQVFFDK